MIKIEKKKNLNIQLSISKIIILIITIIIIIIRGLVAMYLGGSLEDWKTKKKVNKIK